MFPTNHIHMGYMDVQAWKNMMSPSANFQARPTKDDHIELWYTNLNLANARDNWYRGSQGVYVWSRQNNTKRHIGDEIDFTWTHMFMDGKVAFQATYGHLFAGGYIQENLGSSVDQVLGVCSALDELLARASESKTEGLPGFSRQAFCFLEIGYRISLPAAANRSCNSA